MRAQSSEQAGPPPAASPAFAGALSAQHMTEADRLLIEDPALRSVWDWLARRYPDRRLTPEASLSLDLGVDSLG